MKDDILDINGELIQLDFFGDHHFDEDNQWIISKRESEYRTNNSRTNDDDIETKDCTYFIPSFIILINIITIFFYSYGLIEMNNDNIEWNFSTKSPVSPNTETFFFRAMNSYPECSSKKSELWRLFTYQFVHSGKVNSFIHSFITSNNY
jgi:membrane associated rhomboid family serine protease